MAEKEKKKVGSDSAVVMCWDCEIGGQDGSEDPELTSSCGHRTITTVYRATMYENILKTSRKDFLQVKKIKKELERRGRDLVKSSHTLPGLGGQGRWPTEHRRRITIAEFSQKSEGPKLHIKFPSLGELYGEDELTEHLALKASWDWLQDSWRITGNTDPTLKGCAQNLHAPRTSTEEAVWKEPLLADFKVSQKVRRQLGVLLGTPIWQGCEEKGILILCW